jgi:hypothetical protein
MLFFREEDFSLHLVSKDFNHNILPKVDYILDGSKLGVVAADDRGNIQLFQQNRR